MRQSYDWKPFAPQTPPNYLTINIFKDLYKFLVDTNDFVFLRKLTAMDTKEILIKNIDMLCYERKWNRRALAKKMGIMEASLSRSLNGNPTLETLEKIAKALDVSIKSLFNDPADFEGFV